MVDGPRKDFGNKPLFQELRLLMVIEGHWGKQFIPSIPCVARAESKLQM